LRENKEKIRILNQNIQENSEKINIVNNNFEDMKMSIINLENNSQLQSNILSKHENINRLFLRQSINMINGISQLDGNNSINNNDSIMEIEEEEERGKQKW
jgi:hypothetical protein